MINSRHTTHGDVEAADFVQRHSFLITPLALVSNCTRRIKGSGADGLLSEDERTELKHACAVFGVAWKASYDRPLTPNGHIVVAWCRGSWTSAASVASSGRMAARRFTCWTRSAVRSYGKCATPNPRHQAHTLHHTARSFTPVPDRYPPWELKEGRRRSWCWRGSGGWRRRWPVISY